MWLFKSIFFLLSVNGLYGAKILGFFPHMGYSQFILGDVLLTELARKGHSVTMIGAYRPKETLENYRSVLIGKPKLEFAGDFFSPRSSNLFGEVNRFNSFFLNVAEYVLADKTLQQFIRSAETFDLAIVELFGSESHLAIARHFNCSLIGFSSQGLSEWNSHLVGNIRLPSLISWSNAPFSTRMTFSERLLNTLISHYDLAYKYFVYYPQHQRLIEKYYPGNINLEDVVDSVDLVLLNSHYTTVQPTALTTASVEIGGFHVRTNKLPADIQTFLDGATDGAVLFSLGTNAQSKDMPKSKVMEIVKAVRKLKQRVLWKYEGVSLPDKPENLMIAKWLPQSDVLAHPNIVAFVSHGGLLSTTEAMHSGVPIIGIPLFGDQPRNVKVGVEKGTTIHLPLETLNEGTFYAAVEEITKNPRYKYNAKRYSTLLKDRPIKPMDLAIYWIEHILEHKGGRHLRNASKDLHWFQLYPVDIMVTIFAFSSVLYFSIRKLFNLMLKKKVEKVKVK